MNIFSAPYLFVLIGRHCYELGLWERLAADHFLDAAHLHDVDPGLVLVQGVQHDLQRRWVTRDSHVTSM